MSESRIHVTLVPGNIVALVFSWVLNHSIGWAILHFLFGWFYVGYALITRGTELITAFKILLG